MAAAARKPVGTRVVETAPGVTVRHSRLVQVVKAMRVVVVKVAVGGGEVVELAGDDVLPTPAAPKESGAGKAKSGKAALPIAEPMDSGTLRGKHYRTPGSDNHVPRQQDVFLTCGDPEGTLPCRCPFDRAHSAKPGTHFESSVIASPGRRGSGGRRPRADSTARRYPAAMLNHRGYSDDAAADDLYERQMLLASWGVDGYGVAQRDDDGRTGFRVYEHYFGKARGKGDPRTELDGKLDAMIRRDGLSRSMRPIVAKAFAEDPA